MLVRDAQREMRQVYSGGSIGQLVSGVLWAGSAALATWGSHRQAILFLALGGVFIFPVMTLLLVVMRRKSAVDKQNPLSGLAMQVAFTVPLSIPLIGAASLHNINWFYPAFMVVVGAHYLPFIVLYGMLEYAVLAALLLGGGIWLGMRMPHEFAIGGWATAIVLLLFAAYAASAHARRERQEAA